MVRSGSRQPPQEDPASSPQAAPSAAPEPAEAIRRPHDHPPAAPAEAPVAEAPPPALPAAHLPAASSPGDSGPGDSSADDKGRAKALQVEHEVVLALLQAINRSASTHDLVASVARFLQEVSGCQAVGIRLREGLDFPYVETRGLPPQFVQMENYLCLRDADGQVVCEPPGNPVLECMCGNVLCGRFDPAKPFFTQRGSFWTNGTSRLLASTTPEERQARTRNRCNGEGYESVALIPLRCGSTTLGLLQFNDRRPGRFTASLVALLEHLADNVAMALIARRAQDAAADSETALRCTLEASDESILLMDCDGIVLQANRTTARRLNTTVDGLVGRCVFDFLPPDLADSRRRKVAQAIRLGTLVCFEDQHAGRFIESSVYPVPDAQGRITRLAVFGRDVTDQRLAEGGLQLAMDALQRERDHLEAVMNGTGNCLLAYLDRDFNFVHVNRTYARVARCRPEDLIGRNHFDLYPDPENEIIFRRVRDSGQGEEYHDKPFLHPHQGDGGVTYWDWTLHPTVDGGGQVCGLVLSLFETTQRKQAEQALHNSQTKLRAALESMNDAVVITDAQGRFVDFNEAFAVFHRFADKAESLRKLEEYPTLFEVLDLEGRVVAPEHWPLALALRGQSGSSVECIIRRRDSGQSWYGSYSFAPIRDENDRVVGAVLSARDISDRKRAEEDKARLQAQLLQAQKMEAIGRLAAGIAHDINNQLTVIRGYSDLLLARRDPGDPLTEPVREIRNASQRAYSTTSHLLAYSRKQILRPELTDLNQFLLEIQGPSGKMIGEDVRLVLDTCPRLPPVLIDRAGLHQAVMNLIVNARDAMPTGGELRLRTACRTLSHREAAEMGQTLAGLWVVLEVADTGVGMDPDVMEHLFEPFFTTKPTGQGTGLGLPMVQGFVRQSGGAISARSQVGRGTVFTILLPAAAPAQEASSPEPASVEVAPAGGPETVLVVEDEQAVRNLVAMALRQAGYHVHSASGPEEALRLIHSLQPPIHLLVSDVVMPGMSGTDVARTFKRLHPQGRILYITGYAGNHTAAMTNCLLKPFSIHDFLQRVRQTLET